MTVLAVISGYRLEMEFVFMDVADRTWAYLFGRRSRALCFLAVVGLVLATGWVGAAPAAAATVAGFEIDGDMTSQGADDWATVGGQPVATDPIQSPTDNAFAGPSAGELDPPGWIVENAQVNPAAGDIGDIYALGRVYNGQQYAFLGFVRAASPGSILINVELNQRPNTINANGVSIPDREPGDLLIDVEKQGGAPAAVTNVYRWNGTSWTVEPGGVGRVESATNTTTITDVRGNSVPPGQFAELAVDLGTLLGDATCPGPSFPVVNIRTRSASPVTSQLKDYVHYGALNVPDGCGRLAIHKVDNQGHPLSGATFEISPNPIPGETGTLTVQDGSPGDADGAANGQVLLTGILPGQYTVTEAGTPAGYLPSSTSQQVTVPEGNQTQLTFQNTPIAVHMVLAKTGVLNDSNGNGLADVGETITYSYQVTNTGNVPLTNIAVNDPKVGPVTCDATDLAPNAQTTCTATTPYTVSQPDVNAGLVRNEATATAQGPNGENATSVSDFEVPANGTFDLEVIKNGTLVDRNGNGLADVGETINYTFKVINTGTVSLTNIAVNDPKVGPVTCDVTDLAPGQDTTCSASYVVTQQDIDAGQVRNTATATGTTPDGTEEESPPSIKTVDVNAEARLIVEKTATLVDQDGDGLADPGETINYTFTVTNTGTVSLTGVVVRDSKLGTVTCEPTDLAPNAQATCTASHVVTQQDIDAGAVTNVATASATTPDNTEEESPPFEDNVPVDNTPRLALEKTATLVDRNGNGLADVGETINYSFLMANTGNVALTGIVVHDSKLGIVTCEPTDLAPGQQTTCSASHVVTQQDIDAGAVTNVATANGTTTDGTPAESPPSEQAVTADVTPGLTVEKSAALVDRDGDGLADAGETINYTFTVTNTGNVTLESIAIDDPKVGTVACPPGPLPPGGVRTCTVSYTVTQADVDASAVRNSATATATTPGGDPVESLPAENAVNVDNTPNSAAPGPTQPGPGPAEPVNQAIPGPSNLPNTGFPVLGPVLLGLALLLAGGAILTHSRKSRR